MQVIGEGGLLKLIIKEYLTTLKEDKELDLLLSDLLLNMRIMPLIKPEKGVRQYGVDLMGFGKDEDDNKEKLFLFVVKKGDLDRQNWDSGPQAIRPTLNEIKDTYIPKLLENKYKNTIIKVITVFNGDIKQSVYPNFIGYIDSNQVLNKIEYDYWNGDKLTLLVEQYILNENLFPPEYQKSLRKTLALIGDTDYNLNDYYMLIDQILNSRGKSLKHQIQKLRIINLCLNIVLHWCEEANNIKPAVFASERTILRIWEWKKNIQDHPKKINVEIANILSTLNKIWTIYFVKVAPSFSIKDGLFGYGSGADRVEYPLLTFEQIGIISLIGINHFYNGMFSNKNDFTNEINIIGNSLINLITNNNICFQPLYDGHIIDISLALLLLKMYKKDTFAKWWIKNIADRIVMNYRLRKFFPLFSDSYDELIENEFMPKEPDISSSTLLYILLEWAVIYNDDKLYDYLVKIFRSEFSEIDLQLWYPDEKIEEVMYKNNASLHSGTMFTTKFYDISFEEIRKQMEVHFNKFGIYDKLTFMKEGIVIIGLIASRHFRAPIFPFYWRGLLFVQKQSEKGE